MLNLFVDSVSEFLSFSYIAIYSEPPLIVCIYKEQQLDSSIAPFHPSADATFVQFF